MLPNVGSTTPSMQQPTSRREESETPFKLDGKRFLGLRLDSIVWLIAVTFGLALAYSAIKNEQSRQGEKLQTMDARQSTMEQTLSAQRDIMLEYRFSFKAMNDKLDYLAGGRRGPAPDTGTPH